MKYLGPTPPVSVITHAPHIDTKLVWTAVAALVFTVFIVKVWNALPKWLLVVLVIGVLVSLGAATLSLGGTTADHSGVHR